MFIELHALERKPSYIFINADTIECIMSYKGHAVICMESNDQWEVEETAATVMGLIEQKRRENCIVAN